MAESSRSLEHRAAGGKLVALHLDGPSNGTSSKVKTQWHRTMRRHFKQQIRRYLKCSVQ